MDSERNFRNLRRFDVKHVGHNIVPKFYLSRLILQKWHTVRVHSTVNRVPLRAMKIHGGVEVQLHSFLTPAVSPVGKSSRFPLNGYMRGPHTQCAFGEGKFLLPLPEINSHFPVCATSSLITVRLFYIASPVLSN